MVLIGLLMGGGNFALLFIGLQTATPSAAGVVLQLGLPISTVLAVVVLSERIGWRRGCGIVLTLAGVMIVIWDPSGWSVSPGLLFVAASAAAGSVAAILMKQMEIIQPLRFQAWVGATSLLPLAAGSALVETGQLQATYAAGAAFVAAVLFSALIVSVAAHTTYYGLIQRYDASLITPLTLMTPLATIGLGVLITHDELGSRMLVGTALALAGVLVVALRGAREVPPDN
jgi:drug/metabolite transporter (DMT)-like permease